MADPYRYFRVEAAELTEALQAGLLELEAGGEPSEPLARVLRHAHTLKGAARVVRHEAFANLAHEMEEVLVPVRERREVLSSELISRALSLLDRLREMVVGLGDGAPVVADRSPGAAGDAVGRHVVPVEKDDFVVERGETARLGALVERTEVERLSGVVASLGVQLARIARAARRLDDERSAEQWPRKARSPREARSNVGRPLAADFVSRTPLAASPVSMRLVSGAESARYDVSSVRRELEMLLDVAINQLREVSEGLEHMGLVEVGAMRTLLARTARDTALAAGKRVRFEFYGGSLRIDSELYQAASRALLQAVKNAVAHGVEVPSARAVAGKPEDGRVVVRFERRGTDVHFGCEDDGRGLDLSALRQLIARRGGSRTVDDVQVIDELLRGGLSTASGVNAIAGRGIGLDLVRESIESVDGELHLSHDMGKGVNLRMIVRSRRTAWSALLVESRGVVYGVPVESVSQAARLDALTVSASGTTTIDGSLVTFRPLASLMEPDKGQSSRRASWTVILLESSEGTLALGVDRLLGTETVVATRVPDALRTSPGIASIARDVDGSVRFLLDPAWLYRAASGTKLDPSARAEQTPPILVIDDSLTTRMLERSILESAGYEVDLATSAEEGLTMAREKRYGLFLVDVEMPGMDGFTFVELTRADPALGVIPAILVTSRSSPEDLARGVRAGARAHVVKSEFDQNSLLQLIGTLVKPA